MADEGMCVFSARQVTSLAMSSMLAVNDSLLMVVFPSGDFCSSACFSLVTPIHQVIVAGGWDPDEMQVIVDTLSADSGFFSLTIFTDNGRTKWRGDREKNVYNLFFYLNWNSYDFIKYIFALSSTKNNDGS